MRIRTDLLIILLFLIACILPATGWTQDFANINTSTLSSNGWNYSAGGGTVAIGTRTGYPAAGLYEIQLYNPASASKPTIYYDSPLPSDYIAFTLRTTGTNVVNFYLLDSTKATVLTTGTSVNGGYYRYEIVRYPGNSSVFLVTNGTYAYAGTSSVSPSYIKFESTAGMYAQITDIVYGNSESHYFVTSLPSGWQIIKPLGGSGSTGLYDNTGTYIGSSLYKGWAKPSNITPATIYLVDQSTATPYNPTTITSGEAGIATIDVSSGIGSGTAPYGQYYAGLSDRASSYFYYTAGNNYVITNQATYTPQDTAVITWSIEAAQWIPATYDYSIKIYTASGSLVETKVVTTQTGTTSVVFADNPAYVGGLSYLVYLTATAKTGGTVYLIGSTTFSLQDTLQITGYVIDGETGLGIPYANISFRQGATTINASIASNGYYNASPLTPDILVGANYTATGYSPGNFSFTPLSSKTYSINLTMLTVPTTSPYFTVLKGVITSTPYNQPIWAANVTILNATTGRFAKATTNLWGFYKITSLNADEVFDWHFNCTSCVDPAHKTCMMSAAGCV